MPLIVENSSLPSETYEEAVQRTGRKYPYRTQDWPCPACWQVDCDLDTEAEKIGYMRWVYRHVLNPSQGAKSPDAQPTESKSCG